MLDRINSPAKLDSAVEALSNVPRGLSWERIPGTHILKATPTLDAVGRCRAYQRGIVERYPLLRNTSRRMVPRLRQSKAAIEIQKLQEAILQELVQLSEAALAVVLDHLSSPP